MELAPGFDGTEEDLRHMLRNHIRPSQADRGSRGVDPKEETEDESGFRTKAKKVLLKGASSMERGGPRM